MLQMIYNHIVGFLGTLVVGAFIIWIIVALIERGRLSAKCKDGLCIITGASSGLGAAYAKHIDAHPEKYHVKSFLLIARNVSRLNALAETLSLPTEILSLDLTQDADLKRYDDFLQKKKAQDAGFDIALLINCAGFGKKGATTDVGAKNTAGMIAVNDTAAAALIDLTLPAMHPGSRILNVCSVAGFQPIPFFAAYAASKSFLLSYSRALRVELLPRKISVTAVCPYWISDTAFISTAYGKPKKLFMSSKTDSVARLSLSDTRHNHAVSTPSFMSTLDRIFCGMIPDGLLAYIMTWFL